MADPNDIIKAQQAFQEFIQDGTKLQEIYNNLTEAQQQHFQNLIKVNAEHKKSFEYLEQQIKILEQQQKIVESMEDSASKKLELDKIELDLQEAIAEQKRKKLLEDAKGRDLTATELENYKGQLKELERIEQKRKDIAGAAAAADTLLGFLGISERNKDTLTYRLLKNPEQVFGNLKSKIEAMGGFGAAFGISLGLKVVEATAVAFQQTDAAISGFVAATGATAAYNNVIVATARGNTALGISFKESGKAVTDLYVGLNTFTKLNQSAQAELTVTTAKLEKLGISGNDTAKSIATLSEMMKISETQAAKVVEEFAAMGQAIGVSSKQMISDFVAVKDQLAVFGNEMSQVFKDLEAQSKATGVAVSDLLTLTNKFDTFSSAANNVGKLNAILGGPYLSTMAMIEATDPTERIDMLRQAVDNAGISFDQLSYYEKKAIMEAGGFKSVEEAQRVLSMSAGDYAKQLETQRATQEQLNDAIQRAQPIQEKLSLIAANFAIVMSPIVELLSSLLSIFAMIVDNPIGNFIFKLAIAFALLYTPIGWVASALFILANAIQVVHDWLMEPHSPILFFALIMLPYIFDSIGIAALNIANAISITADSFIRLHDAVVKSPESFFLLAGAMTALSAAMAVGAVGGIGNKLASMFNADLASQIEDIAEAVSKFDDTKLLNFKVVLEKAVEVSNPEVLSGFESFKDNFEAVVKATADFEIKKAQSFTNLLTATQNLSQNLQLKQDIKVLVDSQEIKARITKDQGRAALQEI